MEQEIGLVSTIAYDRHRTVVALREYQLLVLDTNKEGMVFRVTGTVLERTIAEEKPGVEGAGRSSPPQRTWRRPTTARSARSKRTTVIASIAVRWLRLTA